METFQRLLIAGPCAIESEEIVDRTAAALAALRDRTDWRIYFKASFDKANRTSIHAFRGLGMDRGLQILDTIRQRYGLPILTDIHEAWQAAPASEIADVLQIPAFLCRQTDLITAAARSDRIVNIKKGQFLSGDDMRYPIEKARAAGAREVWATERGELFGYNDLIVDFRNIPRMRQYADKVVMDCTHAVQTLGGEGDHSGGDIRYVPMMAQAARAFGVDGLYFEIHPTPQEALSDSWTMITPARLSEILDSL